MPAAWWSTGGPSGAAPLRSSGWRRVPLLRLYLDFDVALVEAALERGAKGLVLEAFGTAATARRHWCRWCARRSRRALRW